MQRFFLILAFLICLIYSHSEGNKYRNNPKSADTCGLKQLEESMEEFNEQFTNEVFDPEII